MTTVSINSVPGGAYIDVESSGPGPGPTPSGFVDEFRNSCFSGDQITGSWFRVKSYLESGQVGEHWWEFTRNERYAIATFAINNTQKNYYCYRQGKPNCEGGGNGELKKAVCIQNATIRALEFGPVYSISLADCCYKVLDCHAELKAPNETCYEVEKPYCLPFYNVICTSNDGRYAHAMGSILIENNYSKLSNWVVFQWDACDIKPGDTQMPCNSVVLFGKPHKVQSNCTNLGYTFAGDQFNV